MISNMYYYSSGCSFGQCIDSNLRTDKCVATEMSQLLKVRERVWAELMKYLWVWSIGGECYHTCTCSFGDNIFYKLLLYM